MAELKTELIPLLQLRTRRMDMVSNQISRKDEIIPATALSSCFTNGPRIRWKGN